MAKTDLVLYNNQRHNTQTVSFMQQLCTLLNNSYNWACGRCGHRAVVFCVENHPCSYLLVFTCNMLLCLCFGVSTGLGCQVGAAQLCRAILDLIMFNNDSKSKLISVLCLTFYVAHPWHHRRYSNLGTLTFLMLLANYIIITLKG